MLKRFMLVLLCLGLIWPSAVSAVEAPENMVVKNVPEIPETLQARVDQYRNVRSAGFVSWLPDSSGMLIATRFGETAQLHRVTQPGGRREQISFFKEPLSNASFPPLTGRQAPQRFLFTKDVGGSEMYQLFSFDLKTGSSQMLSDGKSRNGSALWSNQGDRYVYRSTKRNQKDYDIYLASPWDTECCPQDFRWKGQPQEHLIFQGEGYWSPMHWSPDDKSLLVYNYISANSAQIKVVNTDSGQARDLFPQLNGKVSFGSAFFSADGKGVFYTSDQSSEFKQLHYRDLASGKMQRLADIPWDINEMEISPDGQHLALVTNEDGVGKLRMMDTQTRRFLTLPDLPVGQIYSIYFSPDSRKLAMTMYTSQTPGDVYTFDLNSLSTGLTRWTYSEVGGLDTSQFSEAKLIRYPSFDQKQIPAFYFHPPQVKKAPVIIYIHGGPESQYRPGFSSLFQYWLNEMGIAVIAPNVRGSRGYGKAYLKLDNGYQREDSVKDIGALLDWIATQPQLDKERVAVYGGSYGGYMVLASMIHYGDRLKAGVESVGISNFVTFLENTKAYRRDLRRVEYGDERDANMRAFLQRISPTTRAHEITDPLMVVQGLNDPRVPASEAEQIVAAVEKNGQPVWYLLAKDEGHGFKKKPNRDFYYYAMALFWEEFLLN